MSQSNSSCSVVSIESFFGVYLLYSLNPKYKGRCYIGFTVDPTRRLEQHNKGKQFGGAHKTSSRGPWEMILIVHGFPNMISALRFEWAWQHPKRSRRLAHVNKKKSTERMFEYNFRLLSEMLNLGPWNKLALTIRWLRPDVKFCPFPSERRPPSHMQVVQGPCKSVNPKAFTRKNKNAGEEEEEDQPTEDGLICSICIEAVELRDKIQCLSDKCLSVSHLICLANAFTHHGDKGMLPVQGDCPVCGEAAMWGDLVKAKKLQVEGMHKKKKDEEKMDFSDPELY